MIPFVFDVILRVPVWGKQFCWREKHWACSRAVCCWHLSSSTTMGRC